MQEVLWVVAAVLLAGVGLAMMRIATAGAGRRLALLGSVIGIAVAAFASIAATASAAPYGSPRNWLWVAAAVVAAVLALWPWLAGRLLPPGLLVIGMADLVVARSVAYGSVRPLLALAWVSGLAGLWLTWRSADPALARGWRLFSRVAALPPRTQLRALLLLPVALAAAAFYIPDTYQIPAVAAWLLLFLSAAVAVLSWWPVLATQLAAAGLVAFGGYLLAATLVMHSYDVTASLVGPLLLYGYNPDWVRLEALVMLALGITLVPPAFPAARRLLFQVFLPFPSPDPELQEKVAKLTESRAEVVDTAASDLRRLERDLHDGAQVRLVALGMNLRAAERLITDNPAAAAALVAEAREASARALTELRQLVRGVHPPVLADRGLADAVRALALDCPLAVQVEIDLPGRVAAPVETACYFAVAELLANAAKHSGARDARVDVSHDGGVLRVEVTDFGLGGADPDAGSGLAGLEKRLAAFDGIMAVSSPPGGPTIVALEVPCSVAPATASTS